MCNRNLNEDFEVRPATAPDRTDYPLYFSGLKDGEQARRNFRATYPDRTEPVYLAGMGDGSYARGYQAGWDRG